jgi:hypothetical protein
MAVNMDDARRNEIALKLVEQMVIERGIPGADVLKRDIGNMAKKLNISKEELIELYQWCLPRLLANVFGCKSVKVSLVDNDGNTRTYGAGYSE